MRNLFRLLGGLALLAGLFLLSTSPARAAGAGVDIPGVDVCPKNAPFAATPESGLPGLLGERPIHITTDNSPDHIWSTGGFAGLRSHTYDMGCALDPTSWVRIANANTDSRISNTITSAGDSVVALTDSVDRRAWQPGWVISFLDEFARRATGVVNTEIMLPFLGLTIIASVGIMIFRSHRGDISASASSTGWIFVVLLISTLVVSAPLMIAKVGQSSTGMVVAALNSGDDPSDAATNKIVKNVAYQAWLRHTFGTAESATAVKYGPSLLASTRVSWAELDAINASKDQGKAREALTKVKAKQYKDIAAKVEQEDPTAYQYLTGREMTGGESLAQLAFMIAASMFRLAVSILMITATITLVLLAIMWLVLTPLIIMPRIFRFSGQEIGMGLINSAVKAIGFVLAAAVGSWLFGVYLQSAMAPGMSLWWSLLLLIIGSGIAWTTIRPDRKFLSIVSLGRVDGYGYVGRMLRGFAMAYIGGRIAGRTIAEHDEKDEEDTPSPAPQVVQATIFNPARPFVAETATHVDGEPLQGRVVQSLPSSAFYERPTGTPNPPPDAARSPYEPYVRTDDDDNEGAVR